MIVRERIPDRDIFPVKNYSQYRENNSKRISVASYLFIIDIRVTFTILISVLNETKTHQFV